MSPPAPFFTVLTPTYNRAHTLDRVYQSLRAQTCRDFEWLIVDDGSTDGTRERVEQWIGEAALTIRYLRQANGGKHVAFNRGVTAARGELIVPLDSDDACVPQALERFRFHWLAIPVPQRERFCGILCLCQNERGELLGAPLPQDVIDGPSFEVTSRLRRTAEMWIAVRTDVLRRFPFPEYPGEPFVPEALVWNRIGRRYLSRVVNEALRTYFVDSPDSLSRSSVRLRASSPRGTLAFYGEAIDLPVRLTWRLRAAANLWRFALASKRLREALRHAASHAGLAVLGLPLGVMLHVRDRTVLRSDPLHKAPRCRPG
jgi:glycosyltransferase involved in cell wall biosynthesis